MHSMPDKTIHVTEPFLPPMEDYVGYLKGIWERNWLTNNGPLLKEFEIKLQDYLRLKTQTYTVANGGLGLQLLLKAMGIQGEVVTTPFSYVATTSCPLWEGCKVKFADIEPEFMTLDPSAVEAAITPKTEAIIGTHVFGNPCDCEALELIAKRHGLALVFDAAHAFGVRYKERSILDYGDTSMVSLHATKLMHSVEGGFVVAKDPAVAKKVEWMRRFGHNGNEAYHGIAINAKMSEFHAAMGLCVLEHIDSLFAKRAQIAAMYRAQLSKLDGFCRILGVRPASEPSYGYVPLLLENERLCINIQKALNNINIAPRRYFYPLLDRLNGVVSGEYPTAKEMSVRILCLPSFDSLELGEIEEICSTIEQCTKGGAK